MRKQFVKRSIAMTALVAMLAIGAISLSMAPSAEAAKKRSSHLATNGSYVYAKMIVASSSIDGIDPEDRGIDPEDRVYFAWETGNPLRINAADRATGEVFLAKANNVTVNNDGKTVTMTATITESGIAGLSVGDTITYTAGLVTKTATLVNKTTGQSASGESIYANVG